MEFELQLQKYINSVNTYLHSVFDNKTDAVYEAMRYSLYAGGKRVRPVLSLAVTDALKGNAEAALCFGCSLEMIHTYSLIHDDLPCMDNDDLRRGKPTNHKVFGEDMAVLAGDALLNFACENIAAADYINPDIRMNALKILYTASGAEGMIGGQVLDMQAEGKSVDINYLELLHRRKTGALIQASAALGAISAEKPNNILDSYSESLGLAFQIRDDILDVEGDAEKFGKPILSDEKNNKTTYVTLFGIDGAKKRLTEETEKAIDSLQFLGNDGEFLRKFALYLLNREN